MSLWRDMDEERERREWEAQERAVRAERLGARNGHDPAVAQYRLIVRALRKPPLSPLRRDFAASVAARVEQRSRAANEHVEIWLGRGLVMLLVLAGAAAVSVYFGESLRDLAENLTPPEPRRVPRANRRKLGRGDRRVRRSLCGVQSRTQALT